MQKVVDGSKEPYDVKVTSNAGIATTGDDLINVDVTNLDNCKWFVRKWFMKHKVILFLQVTATDVDGDTITYSVYNLVLT